MEPSSVDPSPRLPSPSLKLSSRTRESVEYSNGEGSGISTKRMFSYAISGIIGNSGGSKQEDTARIDNVPQKIFPASLISYFYSAANSKVINAWRLLKVLNA